MSAQPRARRSRPAPRGRRVLARPRVAAAPAADRRPRRWSSLAVLLAGRAGRSRGARDPAPAPPRGHHPPAGGRQGRRRVADRRGHLHRVALPRPDLARGRQGPDAAHAGRPPTTSPASPAARGSRRADLATPQINIAYGTWYLRYLLDKYHGNTILALAAYNAGEGKVDEWCARGRRARREVPRRLAHPVQGDTRLRAPRALRARATTGATTRTSSRLSAQPE